jgi:hypothetical protein
VFFYLLRGGIPSTGQGIIQKLNRSAVSPTHTCFPVLAVFLTFAVQAGMLPGAII